MGEVLSLKPKRSVAQILNHPARLAYDFKIQQEKDAIAKYELTLDLIRDILKS